jgi:GxxExxY protein
MTQMNTDELGVELEEILVRERGFLYGDLTYSVIGAAMNVHSTLGPGFLEKVYERALVVALGEAGIEAVPQAPVPVHYHGVLVGDYYADILVAGTVILELKTVDAISDVHSDVHRAQVINYLKATGLKVALLINFAGPKLQWERIVC